MQDKKMKPWKVGDSFVPLTLFSGGKKATAEDKEWFKRTMEMVLGKFHYKPKAEDPRKQGPA